MMIVMSGAEARLELMVLQSKAEKFDGPEFDATFTNAGLPPEVLLRLKELLDATCHISAKVIRVGKVVLMELARFYTKHSFLLSSYPL